MKSPSVCHVLPVPSALHDLVHVDSTDSSMTLSWQQSGSVDKYIIESNNTPASSFNIHGVGNVSATVRNLPTAGSFYCISIIAVSGHLYSDEAHLCNYTGNTSVDYLQDSF